MSREIGLNALHLRPTPRPAHIEACSNDALIRTVVANSGGRPFEDVWEYDYSWVSCGDDPVPWEEVGRVTDMGHAEFLEGGVDKRQPKPCPFTDAEQVLAFDAVEEYGLTDFDRLVAFYERSYQEVQGEHPDQLVGGYYYKTIVSGAIQAFGWDMLLLAAADQDRFERVLDSFFRYSLHHYRAWAETSVECIQSHDDMVWSMGPFINPDFYRRVIFPRYRELWAVVKAAGKKVIYCSDGNWTQFLDDIVAAGADGFVFEPMVPFETVVQKYGRSHVLMGSNVDCRTLTFGTKPEIQIEIDSTLELARGCPGFVFFVANHIPSNVPVENALFYFEYLKAHWYR